ESACLRGEREGRRPPVSDDGPALRAWLREPAGPGISRYLLEAWHWRDDLRTSWPDPCGADALGFAWWSWEHGIDEMDLVPALLLPAAAERCRVPGGGAWHWALEVAWSELGSQPADPLSDAGWAEFRRTLQEPVDAEGVVNRYLFAAARRPDLAASILDPTGAHRDLLLDWAWTSGVKEGLDPRLLPPSPKPLSRGRQAELRTLPLRRGVKRAARRARSGTSAAAAEARARALESVERRLDRPLPGARWRIERRVIAAARRARASYRAEPWPGRVLLVVSTEFAGKPPYSAWEARAQGGVERRELPVGHVEMLREPGVEHLARCLETYIDEALSR
ncbi:MAG TPA: hypothetical protein VHB53_13945, partial [Solirubrobacterales bacterium]|nr:hypothetical protein [Solirubrobacterales bacterium]